MLKNSFTEGKPNFKILEYWFLSREFKYLTTITGTIEDIKTIRIGMISCDKISSGSLILVSNFHHSILKESNVDRFFDSY